MISDVSGTFVVPRYLKVGRGPHWKPATSQLRNPVSVFETRVFGLGARWWCAAGCTVAPDHRSTFEHGVGLRMGRLMEPSVPLILFVAVVSQTEVIPNTWLDVVIAALLIVQMDTG